MRWGDFDYYFDPEDIRIETKALSVNYIMDLISKDGINLYKEFNRRSVWKVQQKSLLIESLLLRIPIPSFYFYEDKNWNLHVIDGIQRLTTIYEFINGGFNLNSLNILQECRGLYFNDLPQKLKYRILQTQLHVNIIDARTPKEIQFEVFRRLNSGGTSITSQELRNSVAQERTRDLLNRMASSYLFQELINSHRNERFQLQEYALRFIAFFRAYDPETDEVIFSRGSMEDFLDDHFYEINDNDFLFDTYEEAFYNSLQHFNFLIGGTKILKDISRNKNFIIIMLVCLSYLPPAIVKKVNIQKFKEALMEVDDLERYLRKQNSYKHKILVYFDIVKFILWEATKNA